MMDILLEAGDDAPNVLFVGLVQTQEDLDLAFARAICVARVRCDDPGPGRAARRPALPRRLHVGRVLPALRSSASARVVTLEEGIRRLTSMPARRVGLHGRGDAAPGAGADVTCSTRRRSRNRHGRGTERLPGRRPRRSSSTAAAAMRDGGFVDAAAGSVLRRSGPARRHDLPEGSPAMTIMTVLGPIEDDAARRHPAARAPAGQPVRDRDRLELLGVRGRGARDRGARRVHGGRRAVDRRDDHDRDRAASPTGLAPDRRGDRASTS